MSSLADRTRSRQGVMPAISPETGKLDSYPWFDWLRFVLASLVVLSHSGLATPPFMSGGMAVQVFFALSGWLIGGILLRTGRAELPRFFFNRSTRIWIPYLLAIAILYSVAALREGIDFFWFKYLVLDTTFTHQIYTFFPVAHYEMPLNGSGNQFWSLAVEEQFYLCAPLVMLFVLQGKSLLVWAAIALGTMALGWNAAALSLGVCAAILERDYRLAHRAPVRIGAIAVAIACAVAIDRGLIIEVARPLFSVAVVVALAQAGRRGRVGIVLGGASYPLYLNHWLTGVIFHGTMKHLGLLWLPGYPIVAYLLALPLGVGLYWAVDRRVQRDRNAWYTPRLGRRLAGLAYGLVIGGLLLGGLMNAYGPRGVVPLERSSSASHDADPITAAPQQT